MFSLLCNLRLGWSVSWAADIHNFTSNKVEMVTSFQLQNAHRSRSETCDWLH